MNKRKWHASILCNAMICCILCAIPMVVCFQMLLQQGGDAHGTVDVKKLNEHHAVSLTNDQLHQILKAADQHRQTAVAKSELSELEALKKAKLDLAYFKEQGMIPEGISLQSMNVYTDLFMEAKAEPSEIDAALLYTWQFTFVSDRAIIELEMNASSKQIWRIKLLNLSKRELASIDLSHSLHRFADYLGLEALEEEETA